MRTNYLAKDKLNSNDEIVEYKAANGIIENLE